MAKSSSITPTTTASRRARRLPPHHHHQRQPTSNNTHSGKLFLHGLNSASGKQSTAPVPPTRLGQPPRSVHNGPNTPTEIRYTFQEHVSSLSPPEASSEYTHTVTDAPVPLTRRPQPSRRRHTANRSQHQPTLLSHDRDAGAAAKPKACKTSYMGIRNASLPPSLIQHSLASSSFHPPPHLILLSPCLPLRSPVRRCVR